MNSLICVLLTLLLMVCSFGSEQASAGPLPKGNKVRCISKDTMHPSGGAIGSEILLTGLSFTDKQHDVLVGYQKVVFGPDEIGSYPNSLQPFRSGLSHRYASGSALGIKISGQVGTNSDYAIGFYADNINQGQSGFAARYSKTIDQSYGQLRLGISYKDVYQQSMVGLDAANKLGSMVFNAEYVRGKEAGNGGIECYLLSASYSLFGSANFDPSRKIEIWELVANYQSGDGSYYDYGLGAIDASALTVGVNWYASANTKLSFDYARASSSIDKQTANKLEVGFQLNF